MIHLLYLCYYYDVNIEKISLLNDVDISIVDKRGSSSSTTIIYYFPGKVKIKNKYINLKSITYKI